MSYEQPYEAALDNFGRPVLALDNFGRPVLDMDILS